MSEIFLSIVIPYFNTVEYLPKLLSSIPNREDVEVIVVDDHSTEGLEQFSEIKERLSGERVLFIPPTEGRKGAGCARNIGIRAAKGRYIAFADSDDYYLPAFNEMIDKYHDSDADMIFFGLNSYDVILNAPSNREGYIMKYLERYAHETKHSEAAELCVRYKEFYVLARFFKRSMILDNKLAFDATIKSNDVYFAMLAGYHARDFLVDLKEVYCMTKRPGSITSEMNLKKTMTTYKVYQRYYFFLEKNLGYKKMRRMGYSLKGHLTIRLRSLKVLWYELFHGTIKCLDEGAFKS